MRVLVVSDTHGDERSFARAIESQQDAKIVFFLGDGIRDAKNLSERHPDREFYIVRGNCDFGLWALYPETGIKTVENRKVFYTHGHRYHVKSGIDSIISAATARGADILLFGHTHQPFCEYRDGLYVFNPGSLGRGGSYGYIDITASGIVPRILEMKR